MAKPNDTSFSISIHALREEGDKRLGDNAHFLIGISIHALREEGDTPLATKAAERAIFLSTPSARRATDYYLSRGLAKIISIHALREEGDRSRSAP